MKLEAVGRPFTYRWPGGEIRLETGRPVELPPDRAAKLLARAAGRVRPVQDEHAVIEPAHPIEPHPDGPREDSCSHCGSRLWCRLVLNVGAWECRRCAGARANKWQELLHVPENWKPVRTGAPNLALRCPGCQQVVSTLLNQPPDGWRCAQCHGLPCSKTERE